MVSPALGSLEPAPLKLTVNGALPESEFAISEATGQVFGAQTWLLLTV